mmetsp:Transcript_33395/g.30388  ORF Transcript_33395/g.30388 Transcript_33395/m.30388 type:complete len:86 (+) Transcript_33395:760-1017(+)
MEVVRLRIQAFKKNDPSRAEFQYNGLGNAFSKIVREEGYSALFQKGLAPRLIKKPLHNSLNFTIFELLHDFIFEKKQSPETRLSA